MSRFRSPLVAAAILIAGLASAGPGSAQEKTVGEKQANTPVTGIAPVRTKLPLQESERQVLGGQWRANVDDARHAASQGRLEAVSKAVAPVIAYCGQLAATERAMVSVTSAEQYQAYLAGRDGTAPVDWVDMACPEAYKIQAFVDVDRRRFGDAEALLGKAIALAPYWADPVIELGAAYNLSQRPSEALATYRRALELIERFPGNLPLKPLALRGVGFAQAELGNLDEAEGAYRSALELDPGNQVAKNELEYIRRQREAAKP